MDKRRLELDEYFHTLTPNVYFQPPSGHRLEYPAIVYKRSSIRNTFANNSVYGQRPGFEVTVIDRDPESEIVNTLSKLPLCSHDRNFTSENLNHDVFTLY